ncbi:MAG: CVNH domain-containing protein [Nostoc sp. DedQUE12a]|nr:CVNH domain-containing protein [Nostoc sp. DedQUE12a]
MRTLSLFLKISVTFLFAVCLFLNLVTGKAWAAGQFTSTCEALKVINDFGQVSLSATCEKKDGSYVDTSIQLNSYIGNNGSGLLSWDRQNLGTGCYDLAVSNDGLLNGKCFDLSKGKAQTEETDVATSIDLDDHIANIDGQLKYE